MSWKSGTDIAEELLQELEPDLSDDMKVVVVEALCKVFEAHDCDTMYELGYSDDHVIADAVRDKYPDWFEDDDAEDA